MAAGQRPAAGRTGALRAQAGGSSSSSVPREPAPNPARPSSPSRAAAPPLPARLPAPGPAGPARFGPAAGGGGRGRWEGTWEGLRCHYKSGDRPAAGTWRPALPAPRSAGGCGAAARPGPGRRGLPSGSPHAGSTPLLSPAPPLAARSPPVGGRPRLRGGGRGGSGDPRAGRGGVGWGGRPPRGADVAEGPLRGGCGSGRPRWRQRRVTGACGGAGGSGTAALLPRRPGAAGGSPAGGRCPAEGSGGRGQAPLPPGRGGSGGAVPAEGRLRRGRSLPRGRGGHGAGAGGCGRASGSAGGADPPRPLYPADRGQEASGRRARCVAGSPAGPLRGARSPRPSRRGRTGVEVRETGGGEEKEERVAVSRGAGSGAAARVSYVPLVVGERRRSRAMSRGAGKRRTFLPKQPWGGSHSGTQRRANSSGAPFLARAVRTGARRCPRSCQGSRGCSVFLNGTNGQVSIQTKKKRSGVFVFFRAAVEVLQSELFVYLELSTAGNARLFAIGGVGCNAAPVPGILL